VGWFDGTVTDWLIDVVAPAAQVRGSVFRVRRVSAPVEALRSTSWTLRALYGAA
jgi:hypothetical protein